MFLAWSPMRSTALAMNRISSERGDGARVFHHEGDELAHDGAELVVHGLILLHHAHRLGDVEARERVERLAQHRRGAVGDVREIQARHVLAVGASG